MEGLSKEYSMDQLPTAPIGKQQVIDLNAGAILRKENKKSLNFCGINPFLLLTFIMLLKCLTLGGWLYREYQVFDFGCQMLRMGADYIYKDNSGYLRLKRSIELDEFLQKQAVTQHKNRPISQSSQGQARTTLVTMTNLQDLPSNSSTPIRMKTIRQRVEEVNRVPIDEDFESVEEEPTIYLSPIQSRHIPPIQDDQMATVPKPKKKGKGKGKKKKNRSTTTPTPPVTKKRKGLGRKKQRLLEKMRKEEEMRNRVATEQTKSPRHLMAPVGNTRSTPRPVVFLDGGVEPIDPNRGHIRSYQMSKATKKPKSSIKLSEETKLMWKMNELNYTTHAMQVKTTEMTKEDGRGMERFIESLPLPKKDRERDFATTEESMREFYSSKATARPRGRDGHPRTTAASPVPVIVALRPENKVREGDESSTQKYAPVAIYYETVIEPPRRPLDSTLAQLEREQKYRERFNPSEDEESKEYFIPSEKRRIYHGFDRSRDAAIQAGLDDAHSQPSTKPPKPRQIEDEDMNARFQDELRSFASNALCLVRTIFDTWCGLQIITSIPYLVGMCLAKRNLFVGHLIFDIFFLGGGFLFSVTLLVLSILLYVAVEGMSTAEFLQWLMFVFVIEALLIVYTLIVYICYQCTERILTSRGYAKASAAEIV